MMELFYAVIGMLVIIQLFLEEKTVNIKFGILMVDNYFHQIPMTMLLIL